MGVWTLFTGILWLVLAAIRLILGVGTGDFGKISLGVICLLIWSIMVMIWHETKGL